MKREAFIPDPQSDARKCSAGILIKILLTAKKKPGLLCAHIKQLLGVLLWKITEAESPKYKTRFQSQAVLDSGGKGKLRHDHVYQREKMIAALKKAAPHEVDDILKKAVGCTVTLKEHTDLSKYKEYDGWERYTKARIVVINTETNKPLKLPPVAPEKL
jgi:hypothetical protein